MNGIVYRYDPKNGEYLGEYQCQMSPLEPGKYLDDVPFTLKETPPAVGANQVACAVDGAWAVKKDHRGVWYKADGSPIEITEIGVVPNQDWSKEMPELPAAPIAVSPWQFRRALNQLGLRSQVETAVANSNDQDLKDGWEFASVFIRTDPLVISMGQALGKTEAEMDALFELAKSF